MKTRDLAAVETSILNFQNGRHWKLKILITLLYLRIFVWKFVYWWSTVYLIIIKCVDTLPDSVIASIKKSKWPQPKTQISITLVCMWMFAWNYVHRWPAMSQIAWRHRSASGYKRQIATSGPPSVSRWLAGGTFPLLADHRLATVGPPSACHRRATVGWPLLYRQCQPYLKI